MNEVTDEQALQIDCPWCESMAGESCTTFRIDLSHFTKTWIHEARRRKFALDYFNRKVD